MSKHSSAVSRTLFSSIGIYTEYVIGMIVSIIIARHLQPAGFGSYSVVVWMVALGVVLTNSGTATAAIKFVAELRGSEGHDLIRPVLDYLRRAQRWFLLAILLIGAAVLLLAGDRVVPELHHGMLLVFLVITVSVRSLYMFNIGIAKGFENFRATAIVAVVSAPLTLLMVAIAGWFDAPVEVFLSIFVVSSFILYLMSRAQIASAIPPPVAGVRLPPELLARVRRHMRLTTFTVALGFLVGSEVEVLFLKMYSSEDSAGQFKVAYQLASGAALLVPGVFGAILLPMMANAIRQGSEVAAQRFVASTRYLTLLAAPLVAFGVVFASAIIAALYGPAYAPAAPVFAACLIGGALMTMTQGGSSLLISADRQGSILVLVSTLVLLKIGLDIALITLYGLRGAIYAYLIIAALDVLAIMLLAIRTSGMTPEWGKLLRICAAAACGAAVAYPLLGRLPPLAAAMSGGAIVALVYLPLTLLFNCWSRVDIQYMQQLHQRLGRRRVWLVEMLLALAYRRAPAIDGR